MTKRRRKKQSCYIVVEEFSKKDNPFIQGAFPLTEEGKEMATKYVKKLSKQHKISYVIREI